MKTHVTHCGQDTWITPLTKHNMLGKIQILNNTTLYYFNISFAQLDIGYPFIFKANLYSDGENKTGNDWT